MHGVERNPQIPDHVLQMVAANEKHVEGRHERGAVFCGCGLDAIADGVPLLANGLGKSRFLLRVRLSPGSWAGARVLLRRIDRSQPSGILPYPPFSRGELVQGQIT